RARSPVASALCGSQSRAACATPPPAPAPPPPPPPPPRRPTPPLCAASTVEIIAKQAAARMATVAAGNFPNGVFMMAIAYEVFRGTISIFLLPGGGVNLKIQYLSVGFRFQSITEIDCGRASSARLVITILRGNGLLPVLLQSCQLMLPCANTE